MVDDPLGEVSSQSPAIAVAPILRRIVQWDERGNPVPIDVPFITKQQLNDLYAAAAAAPYPAPRDPLDPEFGLYDGMSCAEVMVRKQILSAARSGDAEIVMDRLLGRPKQSVESTKLVLTYEDKLKEIARQEGIISSPPPPPIRIVEGERA